MIISELKKNSKLHGKRKEEIIPNNVVDFDTTDSMDLQEDIHEEYDLLSVDRSLLVHPCLKTRDDEQQIVPIVGEC